MYMKIRRGALVYLGNNKTHARVKIERARISI
jgi:hypothetical protein